MVLIRLHWLALKWLLCVMLLLVFPGVGESQSIVETLPGYSGSLPFKLETGYLGVGDLDEVQHFYYFIESERDPRTDPLIFWLAGGPGCSGFSALVFEIGPLSFNYSATKGNLPTLKINPHSWTKVASIIFIDSPVGTGFSYSTTEYGYQSSDTLSAHHAYTFLQKWLIQHPEYTGNQLYVGANSYSGIIAPILVQHILDGNDKNPGAPIKIKGYILGNPYTSYDNDINSRISYAHRTDLISDELNESAEEYCKGDYVQIDSGNTECLEVVKAISDCTRYLYMQHILEPTCTGLNQELDITRWDQRAFQEDINFLRLQSDPKKLWCRAENYYVASLWINNKASQDALNVREGTVTEWIRCRKDLSYTSDVQSSITYHKNLTSKPLRALIYSGDQDLIVPYIGTLKWIKTLGLAVDEEWRPWFKDGQVAGYASKYANNKYSLTFTTIKGGGHTAPEYKPGESQTMINKWLSYYPL